MWRRTRQATKVRLTQPGPVALAVLCLIAAACTGSTVPEPETAAPVPTTAAETPTTTQATTTQAEPVTETEPPFDETITVELSFVSFAGPDAPVEALVALTQDHFSASTGITVDFLEDLREVREVVPMITDPPPSIDVVVVGSFEAPQFGANGWLVDIGKLAATDADYDLDDIIPTVQASFSVGDELFAAPFSAESSVLMYNVEIFERNGIEMPREPTWEQVAAIARTVRTDVTAGICMRGTPGWAELGATLTAIANSYGGTWWEANETGGIGEAQINPGSGFSEAAEFVVSLLQDAGPSNVAEMGYDECRDAFQNGEVAMWYDASTAANVLEALGSSIAGSVGYTQSPTGEAGSSSWLSNYGLAIAPATEHRAAAWEFIKWATSPEFVSIVAEHSRGGWADVPPAPRLSTYELDGYADSLGPATQIYLDAIVNAPYDNPSTTPRPGTGGIQYVGVPEFQDVAARCTGELSNAIAKIIDTGVALERCQVFASRVTELE